MKEQKDCEMVLRALGGYDLSHLKFDYPRNDKPIVVLLSEYPINDLNHPESPKVDVIFQDKKGEQHFISDMFNVRDIRICVEVPEWNYKAYLTSKEWDDRRKEYSSIHPCKCEVCGSNNQVQLHHICYDRLGYEKDMDLVPLCKDCHDNIHQYCEAYKEGVGDLFYIWDKHMSKIPNANNNAEYIDRFICKFRDGLDFIFKKLPYIDRRHKQKFVRVFRDTMRNRQHGKDVLPHQMIIKLINTK